MGTPLLSSVLHYRSPSWSYILYDTIQSVLLLLLLLLHKVLWIGVLNKNTNQVKESILQICLNMWVLTPSQKKKKDMRASDFRFVLCNYYIYLYTQRHLGPGKSSASSWYIVVRPDQRSMTTKHLWIDQSGC